MSITAPKPPPEDVTVAILVGGKSSRFGSDKALAILPSSGLTLLEHAVSVARQIASEVLVVGGEPAQYARFGARVVPDSVVDRGPVAGLVTAMNIAATWCLVAVAVDQPVLTAADLSRLIDGVGVAAAAVFGGPAGGFEPLPAALAVDRCRARLPAMFAGRSPSLRAAIRALEPTIVDPGDVSGRMLDADTPADLARIVKVMAGNLSG